MHNSERVLRTVFFADLCVLVTSHKSVNRKL